MSHQLVDSHCHLDFPELAGNIHQVIDEMHENGVGWALCAGVSLENWPGVIDIAHRFGNVFAAVGIHPDTRGCKEADVDALCQLAHDSKVVAIGETGLDYYRTDGDVEWQRNRFRTHIAAAIKSRKPLIIHSRSAAIDTLAILREEAANRVGGVFHCFTETAEVAREVLDMGFMISFSGIVTFKNAIELKAVAQMVPLDRMLVETDSPYLSPAPYRGKTNQPAYVRFVAEEISRLKGIDFVTIATATTDNFFRLFASAKR